MEESYLGASIAKDLSNMHGYRISHGSRDVELQYSHSRQQKYMVITNIQLYLHHGIDECDRRRPHKGYELRRGGRDERSS